MIREPRVILDLCGGTGAWSRPYRDAGYDVRLVTLPDDVRLCRHPGLVHGILAAPPCTAFSCAGNRWPRSEADYLDALAVVDACMRFIVTCKPTWWALENPVGTLRRWLGPPSLTFHPSDYGDPYTKRTLLWGQFATPVRTPVEPLGSITGRPGCKSSTAKVRRSITPPGFAAAFFAANP